MWISKNKEERKDEFIQTALKLFMKKGYEKTSLNDILREMNITKGSFYHNFESKEDLLNGCVDMIAYEFSQIVSNSADKTELSAIEMLKKIPEDMSGFRKENKWLYEIFEAIETDEKNAFLHGKIIERIIEISKMYLKKILNKGNEEGVLSVADTDMAAEIYISLLILYKQKVVKTIKNKEIDGLENIKVRLDNLEIMFSKMISGLLGADNMNLDYLKVMDYGSES